MTSGVCVGVLVGATVAVGVALAVTVGLCVGITHGGIGPYTVTLQISFFFPILQEIFAFPAFTAFTFTLVFFLCRKTNVFLS